MGEEPAPNGECATPTITVVGNKCKFQCETPGAVFTCSLSSEEFTGDEFVLNQVFTYTLTVYATAPGYSRSKPAKYVFTRAVGDVNGDGQINIADVTAIINMINKDSSSPSKTHE